MVDVIPYFSECVHFIHGLDNTTIIMFIYISGYDGGSTIIERFASDMKGKLDVACYVCIIFFLIEKKKNIIIIVCIYHMNIFRS